MGPCGPFLAAGRGAGAVPLGGIATNPYGQRAVLLSWVLALCLSIAVGLTLEHRLPGLWIVVYTGMFAVFYLLDAYVYDAAPLSGNAPGIPLVP